MNRFKILQVLILIGLGILIYSNTFNSSFQFDDYDSIVSNLNIRNITHIKAIWSFWPNRFITYLTVAFNYHFNQLNVFGYHLFNLLAHLISALLVWWFVLLTFSSPGMKNNKTTRYADSIAFFAALIFVAHPLQTQAVTYIIQRAACLAALFYLGALCLYAKARILQYRASGNTWKPYYIGSILMAALAMFTKEITITLPFMVLLYETYFFRTEKKINWKQLIPFLALLLIIPSVMIATKSVNLAEMHRVSEAAPGIAPVNYLLTQFRVVVTYLRMAFVPFSQNVDYDYPLANSLAQPQVFISLILIAVILIISFKIRSKYRLISFSIFWFFLVLLPESSILPLADVIFEHRLYLPMAGYSIFLATVVYLLLEKRDIRITVILLSIIVAFYSTVAYSRNFYWKSEFSLWDDAIRKSPRKVRAYNERGIAYVRLGNYKKALDNFAMAISLNPDYL
ncbi:MAG: tetratricopeptide repeat protein [Candidatus Omnitrophota bacterium]